MGFAYTRWKEISSEMRYFIDGSRRPVVITDNGSPTKWALPDLPADGTPAEDYAIVSRVFHPDTHAMLVEVAGITQYGTDAAADLVTNPDLMAEALRNAPAGWQRKNMQIVTHVKVVSGRAEFAARYCDLFLVAAGFTGTPARTPAYLPFSTATRPFTTTYFIPSAYTSGCS